MRTNCICGASGVAAALAVSASGSPTGYPSFVFGRTGGNIEPYSVTITSQGAITTVGPVHLRNPDKKLSQNALGGLVAVARHQGFFSLPRRIGCAGALPDFASAFITVSTVSRRRTVTVHGHCSGRFQKLYGALQAAAGIPIAER